MRVQLTHPVIGKGGQKINEIRSQSGCQIRVTDPGTPAQAGQPVNPEERLVTITGQPGNINTAVQMLYAVRLPSLRFSPASIPTMTPFPLPLPPVAKDTPEVSLTITTIHEKSARARSQPG